MSTTEELLTDITGRLDAIGESISETRIIQMVKDHLSGLSDDDPIVRKMRHVTPEAALIGTKFARFGLGVSDIEFLYDLVQSAHQRGMSRGPSEELSKAFADLSDAYYLPEETVKQIDKRAIDDLFPRVPKAWLKGGSRMAAHAEAVRAMDTAESGYGSQLIGAQYVRDLWEVATPQARVFNRIPQFEMMDPTVYLPVEVDFPELLWVGENTANNSSEYTTVKTGSNVVSLAAKKFVIHQMWSMELEEDSLIPFVPFLRAQLAKSMAFYCDSLVLNGDTTNAGTGNINLDDADPADTKHYLAFDGIRHAALVDNTANAIDAAGAITLAKLSAMRGVMYDETRFVDWSHPNDSNDLIYVTDVATADAVTALDEVLAWRINQGGGGLLNGQVASILGHPVISSPALRKTEADGKLSTTAGNNVKGQVVLFNPNGFRWGWRRRIRVETERLPARDQNRLVLSMRAGFGRFTPTAAASGIEASSVLYNITV